MSSVSVNITYRPVKIGWCIRRNDFDSLRKAIRLNFVAWGGSFNPFIVVDDDQLAEILIESFRPDLLLPASNDPDIKKFIDRFPHLKGAWEDRGFIIDKGPSVLDIRHPLRRLHEGDFLKDLRNKPQIPQWSVEDPLSDLLLLTLGQYPDDPNLDINYKEQITSDDFGDLLPPSSISNPLPAGLLDCINPYRISRLFLKPSNYQDDEFGVFLGSISSFEDLIAFWNIRAADKSVVFYDPDHKDRLKEWLSFQVDRQKKLPKETKWSNAIKIYSLSKEKMDLHEQYFNGTERILNLMNNLSWTRLNFEPSIMEIKECNVLGNIHENEVTPVLTFELRDKPFKEHDTIHYQRVMISIKPVYIEKKGQDFTFDSIYCPELNEFYEREMLGGMFDQIRSEPEGIGFLVGATKDYIRISAINKSKMIDNLFSKFGFKVQNSKAGLIAKQIFNQVGGEFGCRIFKIEGVRNLIEEFKADQWFNKAKALNRIGDYDPETSRPRFEKYKHLVVEFIEGRSRERNHVDAFRFLLKKRVLRAGLVVSCRSCQMEYWNSIDEISSEIICSYCGHQQNISPDLIDMEWQYRKSGLFSHDNNQEGAIPVLVAVQQLDTSLHMEKFFFKFSSLIDSDDLSCESDFIAITRGRDGRNQIILSECKRRGNIEENDLKNLSKVAEKFPESRFEIFILLAKFSEFSASEIELIKQYQGIQKSRFIMWSARELEPYEVYENVEKKYEFERYNKLLDGLANATENTYLNPKPIKDKSTQGAK